MYYASRRLRIKDTPKRRNWLLTILRDHCFFNIVDYTGRRFLTELQQSKKSKN